jgi:hypothetical protein
MGLVTFWGFSVRRAAGCRHLRMKPHTFMISQGSEEQGGVSTMETQTLAVLTTALFLAALIERIAEWIMPLLNWAVVKGVGMFRTEPFKWEGPAKLIGISLFNAVFYAVFFGYDFVGPLINSMTEASIAGWRGLLLSIILIAGGSNLIHQIFTKKEAVVVEGDGIRINCP